MIEDRHRPMTIDALLKLKRAERPAPEFWEQFDRELREKQLAAIIEKRPWWCARPRLYAFVVRRRMPLAAVSSSLALLLIGFNAYQNFTPSAPLVSAPPSAVAASETAPAPAAIAETAPVEVATPAVNAAPRVARSVAHVVAAASDAMPAIPLLGDLPPSAATERFDSMSRSMSGDLTNDSATDNGRNLLAGPRDFGPRLMPARAMISEPLAQMQAPSEEHRSRLMAEVYPAMAGPGDVVQPASDRVLNRLSDDRLYSNGGRYDLTSGHDSIKFSIRF